jgi:REP element-mobilizing transposase RayT
MENEPTLTETPQVKPVRCSAGLRPPEENEFAPIVAAVYDRRMENEPGAHREPLQVVAAVCDRRMENEPGAHRDAATEQPLQKPSLRRLDRVFVDSPIYFITACSVDRRPILDCEPVHDAFRTFSLNSPQHGAWIGRYVLMPDHLHLFLSVVEISLSNWVKSLKNTLSKTLRSLGCDAPHWQKGFFDHLLRSGESYSQKWDYVRENPVRAGLVERAEDWPFAGEIHDLEYRK